MGVGKFGKVTSWALNGKYCPGALCVWVPATTIDRSSIPRPSSCFAASVSSPPATQHRSVTTSATLVSPRSSTIARACSRVCCPFARASERTLPIVK